MNPQPAVVLVYDDTEDVPLDVGAATGARRYSALLRRGERLGDLVARLADQAGFRQVLVVADVAERQQVVDRAAALAGEDGLVAYLASRLAPLDQGPESVQFLTRLRLLTEPVQLWRGSTPLPAGLLDRHRLGLRLSAGTEDAASVFDGLPAVEEGLGLADLSSLTSALEFLSGSFAVRHFNQVARDRFEVVKHSRDRDKMRREHDFYGLLPAQMQPFFVQPYGYAEDADGASYRLRRLFVPDLAVQWVNGALDAQDFGKALEHLFHFLERRDRRTVGREEARRVAMALYETKVVERIDSLLAMDAGRRVDDTLRVGGLEGGVLGLRDRYLRAWRSAAGRWPATELVVGHGDLCFSNILYSPSTQLLQLIDPRGAVTADELWTDTFYDVAKLSHSVLGSYDVVVAGLFDLAHDEDLGVDLRLTADPPAEQQRMFAEALEDAGWPLETVRLREASLFLSMLPLHIDVPRRVAAFALRARQVLDEVGA